MASRVTAEYDTLALLVYKHSENGLTNQIQEITHDFAKLTSKLFLSDYQPSIPFIGHLCLLMRFNELELHVWLLTTLLAMVEIAP